MVKVLRCHNFKSQTILPVSREPLVLASGHHKVFIGTCDCFIEVFHLTNKGEWEKYCSFQTGATVVQLEYNKSGGYIAALECKKSRKSRLWDVVSVKVYLNWSIAHTQSNYRTRVRVAGLGFRSSQVETGNHLEVIDIPCEEPHRITTCQETGNLCVVSGGTVKIYHLVEKTIPNSYTTFHDIEMFLQLSFELPVSMASLCEDYFGCCTVDTAQVFQFCYTDSVSKPRSKTADSISGRGSGLDLKKRLSSVVSSSLIHQENRGELVTNFHDKAVVARKQLLENQRYSLIGDRSSRGSSTPSPALSAPSKDRTSVVEDDVNFVQWSFSEQSMSLNNTTNPQQLSGPSISNTLTLPGLSDLGKVKLEEPPLPTVKDLRGGMHQTSGKLTLKQILFKYLDPSDHSWTHIQLIPTYLTGPESINIQSDQSIPVHSGRQSSLSGMCCMISGSRTGFMYTLLWETKLLSIYNYTTDIAQIQTDGSLLYVMMDNSLETYTARCQIMAIHNRESFDNVSKACPPPDMDTCMCGVQQFPGAKQMIMSGSHIILLTKLTDQESSLVWNVYAIEESSSADLYRDMIVFGTRHQFNSADTYHHLLVEGHMVLRSSLIGQTLKEGEESTINDLMSESSALLGDFYALPNCMDWMLCLPYYQMSGLSPVDVVRQAVQYKQHSKQIDSAPESYGKGLVQYVSYILFHGDEPLELKQTDGDLIISVCSEVIPELLADIILFSRLRNYTPETAYPLLQQSFRNRSNMDSKTKAKNLLATASLNLQMCEPELALASVSKIEQKDLVDICISNHQVLHSDFMELSPLSQVNKYRKNYKKIGTPK